MLPDREVCCCPAAPPPPPGSARHGDLPGPGQQGERTLPGESSVKKHQKWTSARLRVHTSVPGCSSASRPDLRGRRRSWRWWWPRRPRPCGPSHPRSRHPRPYLKHSVLKGGVYEQRWWSGSHERDFVSARRAAICRHPLSKTTCSGRDLGRHRGHIRYRCSVPSSTSRPLPECSGYWVLWGRGMFSSQEGGTHTVVIGVVFPPPTAVHLRGVMGHDSTFPDHYITSASLD